MERALGAVFWLSIFIVAYSYCLYPPLVWLFSRCFSRRVRSSADFKPSVGIVIAVYNEEAVIKKKIDNLRSLEYPDGRMAIWVGSDCSTDRTVEVLRAMHDPRIHIWEAQSRAGKTGVLNNLVPQVDADIILFTDANTMHRPDSLGRLVQAFADPRVGGVAGNIEHATRSSSELEENLYRNFESFQKTCESRLHSAISAFGGFYAVRRELFRPIPFNAYSNDDVLIPMGVIRQGYRMIFDPCARSSEDSTENAAIEYARRVRIGAGNFQAFFWLLDFLNPLRGWPWFCFVSHKAARWFSPLFLCAAIVSCALLAGIGAGISYRILFLCGCAFLCAGASHLVVPIRLTKAIYYFLIMNVALAAGLIHYCKGIRSAAWERTKRQ
jgi:cellulose synthase/poly-beta-1,6-N-acetylglucosamine synthase-like glycosyltransferase